MKDLKFVIEDETTNCKQIEYCVDSSYDYFITRLYETYRNKLIGMYKKGLEDIEAYLNEHASEHDGYRIRLDVSEIIRDVEKAVDKAGEL